MIKKDSILVFLFFILLVGVFFYKIFQGLLPIPGDLLIGGYYPWLDYKWGYQVGVPVKNPLLSDVISYSYPIRDLVTKIVSEGSIPLWNPYMFSGMPLLADWQAAVFYPLNIFMVLFGSMVGWIIMIILQPFLSLLFMYALLRTFKLSRTSSIFGSIIFAFSAFMQIFLEYNYLQGGVWLPLLLLGVEKYIQKSNKIWLGLISLIIFITLSAGNFQVSLFSLIITATFFVFRAKSCNQKIHTYFNFFIFYFLGLGLISIQIIPTIELFMYSIRSVDSNIAQQNFGLLPLKQIITFLAPDFFGNPATANSTAFLYHETAGYFGIIPLIFVLYAIIKDKDFVTKFFTTVFFISLILLFDTILGRLLFIFKVPLISTSYASRILYLLTFSAAILAAIGMDRFNKKDKIVTRINLLFFIVLIGIFLGLTIILKVLPFSLDSTIVSLRNLILPISLVSFSLIILKLNISSKIIFSLFILITIFDLFRFGWKYNPYVKSELTYPKTPVIDYMISNIENFRIEREKTEVLPPNTWMVYGLSAPSGYNPLALKRYAQFYNIYNGNLFDGGVSRYLELGNFNSPLLDLLGVKYLLVAKRDNDKIGPDNDIRKELSESRFQKVFEDKSLVVLENTQVLPRVLLYDKYEVVKDYKEVFLKLQQGFDFREKVILDKQIDNVKLNIAADDYAKIIQIQPNKLTIEANIKDQAILMLTDTDYPGWQVYVNSKRMPLYQADGIFRAVLLPQGRSVINFIFNPQSFKIGFYLSFLSLIAIILLLTFDKLKGSSK